MGNIIVVEVEELEAHITSSIEKALAKLLPQHLKAEEYLTRKEVAECYKISLPTVHAWINKGLLTAYKIEGRTLFKADEVAAAAQKVYRYKHQK